ncbi:citryl-CoA lyase [Streptomyces sp. NPDC051018]|uniref:citryl-CoA lyase n=1 Tax=Streptomyces sp. NPDC051018 TaxID=3365639 RepID=UPI0037B4231C
MGSLDGRVAVVTGAGRGLGREHALLLAAEGAKVVVNDPGVAGDGRNTDESPAHQVVAEIRAAGGEAVADTGPADDFAAAKNMIDLAVATFGDLHILVNNAGILRDATICKMTEDDWDAVVSVHMKGHFAPLHHAANHWRARTRAGHTVRASVINTSSTSGLRGNPGQFNYAAAKAGIAAMTLVAARELERYGVRVNAIAPVARTRMTLSTPGLGDKITHSGPGFDPFDPANVSPVVAYLADVALHSDRVASPNWRSSRRGAPGGQAFPAISRRSHASHTQSPWVPLILRVTSSNPRQESRAVMYTTRIGFSKPDSINIYGYDLCSEVIGHTSLADLVFLGAQGRMPSGNESKMLNALMVGVAEHGFTPSSLATRLTWLGAPEATQAAVAAGLLGAGSVYLGASEHTARMLQEATADAADKRNAAPALGPDTDQQQDQGPDLDLGATARGILDTYEKSGEKVPGFGHPTHRPRDPRTARFYELAEEYGVLGVHGRLLQAVHAELERRRGKMITLNGAGAFGALLSDIGFTWQLVRPVVTAARAVGLVGHIAEEAERGTARSMAQQLYVQVERDTDYRPQR